MIEILFTRITSVVAWYHMSFFVISIAMLGMTAGAMLVFLWPQAFETSRARHTMALGGLGLAVSAPVSLMLALTLPLAKLHAQPFLALLLYGLALTAPFVFSGMALTVALTRAGLPPGPIYAVDLLGAGVGCALVIPLLAWMDAPSAALVATALGALGAALCADRRRISSLSAAGLLLVAGLVNSNLESPPLRPTYSKSEREEAGKFEFVGWNSFSRVTVERSVEMVPTPWSLSPRTPPAARQRSLQRRIRIDGEAATWITRDSQVMANQAWAAWDLCNLAHFVRPTGAAAVIGVGGGKDVVSAVWAGHDPVVGLEINPLIVALHRTRMKEFSGLTKIPELELVSSEARSFLARDTRQYSTIVMSLIDTWATQGSGAFSLAENGLYTVEAWELFLSRLQPDGYFSVSRWFFPPAPHETLRMLSLAMETLFRRGVERPRDHIVVLRINMLATMLISPSPISGEDRQLLKREAQRLEAGVLLMPGEPVANPLVREIVEQRDSAALWQVSSHLPFDYTPPTDNRPFFFNVLKPRTWLEHRDNIDKMDMRFLSNLRATQTLIFAAAVSLVLTLVLIGVPLALRRSDVRGWPRNDLLAGFAYFALIGLGFMFVEIGLLSRLNVFLGDPTLALAVLLGGMILAASFGSWLSSHVPVEASRASRFYPLIPAALATLSALSLDPVQTAFSASALPVRLAMAAALVVVPAVGMGICFPLGLRLMHARNARLSAAADLGPWLWGINGAFGVCASALALATSMVWGIQLALIVGALGYLVLVACSVYLGRGLETAVLDRVQ